MHLASSQGLCLLIAEARMPVRSDHHDDHGISMRPSNNLEALTLTLTTTGCYRRGFGLSLP